MVQTKVDAPAPGRTPAATTPIRSGSLLLIAVWAGLVTGWLEAGARLGGKLLLARTVHFDPNMVWMAPVADAALFALPALLIILLLRHRKNRAARAVVFMSALLMILTVLFSSPRIHWLATVILAAGAAVQISRILARRMDRVLSVTRRTTAPLAVLVVIAAAIVGARAAVGERSALAALPAARAAAPNIILIILDTVRAIELPSYGYGRPTAPNLRRLAATGVQFERAFATAPWTLPSHASMFTGRYAHEQSGSWETALDGAHPTIGEVLQRHGYRTAGFNANLMYGPREFGLGRGFLHYEDYALSPGQLIRSSRLVRLGNALFNRFFGTYYSPGRRNAEAMTDATLSWIGDGGRPFFVFINYFDAHEPYAPPEPFDLMFTNGRPSTRHIHTGKRHTPRQSRDLQDAYDGAIAYADREIGRLLEELDRRGLRDNTIVIVTSDHGEEFNEHGYMSHGNGLYVQSLHVPLLISHPAGSAAPGTRIAQPVTLRDLPATALDLAGIGGHELPGSSLAPLWRSGGGAAATSPILSEVSYVRNQPEWYPVSRGDMRSLVAGRFHYIEAHDGSAELYDLELDPAEQHDLATEPGHRSTLNELRASLRAATTDH